MCSFTRTFHPSYHLIRLICRIISIIALVQSPLLVFVWNAFGKHDKKKPCEWMKLDSEAKWFKTNTRLQTQMNWLNHSPCYHRNHLGKRYNITPIQMACYLFWTHNECFGFLYGAIQPALFIDLSKHYGSNRNVLWSLTAIQALQSTVILLRFVNWCLFQFMFMQLTFSLNFRFDI